MAEPSVAAPAQAARRVVSVRDLLVDFVQDTGTTRALAGISLDLHAGRVLGVVGESGCGKSLPARAMHLCPAFAYHTDRGWQGPQIGLITLRREFAEQVERQQHIHQAIQPGGVGGLREAQLCAKAGPARAKHGRD